MFPRVLDLKKICDSSRHFVRKHTQILPFFFLVCVKLSIPQHCMDYFTTSIDKAYYSQGKFIPQTRARKPTFSLKSTPEVLNRPLLLALVCRRDHALP